MHKLLLKLAGGSKLAETVRNCSEMKGKWDLKQILIDDCGLGQLARVETLIASGITEWAEEEVKEYDEPEMDFGPIWGGIPGKLNRQRELLEFGEENDKVF